MAKIELNKSEAAQRQIDTAIRMLFSNEDPVAIHSLSMAAYRIVRDLSAKRSDSYMDRIIHEIIKPGKEKEFFNILHGLSNFLKHADKDPEGIFNHVDEEINDFVTLLACLYYKDLGYPLTPEMTALLSWIYMLYPDLLSINVSSVFESLIAQERKNLLNKTREELIAIGKMILEFSYDHFSCHLKRKKFT